MRDAIAKTATKQSGPVFRDDYESEAPAALPIAESKTLSHLWTRQLFLSGHPSTVRDGSSRQPTHAGADAAFEVAQEGDDNIARETLAKSLSKMSGSHARPQESLRLWPLLHRNGLRLDQRKYCAMFRSPVLIVATLLLIGLL